MRQRLTLFLFAFAFGGAAHAQQGSYALKAARLFDSVTGRMVQPALVVVTGNRIDSVNGSVPAGAKIIDLGDVTLLPGFIDAHTHLTLDFDPDYNSARLKALELTPAEQALHGAANARATLLAGFTMVRDVGSNDFVDVALRNAIADGITPGPRMLVAGNAIGSSGGHCDGGVGFQYGMLKREAAPKTESSIRPTRRVTPCASTSNTAPM